MDLSFVMKLVAKELGLPADIVEEMRGARIEIVESESGNIATTYTIGPERIDWPGITVKLLVFSKSNGTFPVTIAIPNLVMDRLPASIQAKICEVAIG
jgi:hypothetical protein